jgi:aminoglycoside phosphotransferase family enzyme
MSILERIRATDTMLEVVGELAKQVGLRDISEFQIRIASNDQSADIAFLDMADALWAERRDVLQAFFRHYFHQLSRERQWRVAHTMAGSFLDRSSAVGEDVELRPTY